MPKISLIMPVYNAFETLERSVGSVLVQTFKDFEFIVVNDGSTDCSLEELEKLRSKSKADFIFLNKENGGAASARKLGLMNASGDFIGFIDSDDVIDRDYLEKMYDTLVCTRTNIFSSRMAVHLGTPIIRNIPLRNRRRKLEYNTFDEKKIVPIMNVVTNGKLYRSDYIDITDKCFSANEDLSINYFLYAKAGYVSFVNDVTYHYMPNNNGLVSKNISGYTWDKIKNTLFPLSELKSTFEGGGLFDIFYSEIEQLFIKNIFQRVEYIMSNLDDGDEKLLLINTLYDYISFYFPNWQENSYLLSYFKDFEFPDMLSCFKNKLMISNYVLTSYSSVEDIYKKYDEISSKVLIKKR